MPCHVLYLSGILQLGSTSLSLAVMVSVPCPADSIWNRLGDDSPLGVAGGGAYLDYIDWCGKARFLTADRTTPR